STILPFRSETHIFLPSPKSTELGNANVIVILITGKIIPVISEMTYQPPKRISDSAHVKSMEDYEAMYKLSVADPEAFWGQISKEFHFQQDQPRNEPFFEYNFDVNKGPISINMLKGAKTNACYNALDWSIQRRGIGRNIAYHWEGSEADDKGSITYDDLLREVCRFSNALKSLGVKKGDRVVIYMPVIVEITVALLACARIGVVHSVVFGGYSAESVANRILDAQARVVITADGTCRGDKIIPLKGITDKAIELCNEQGHKVEHTIVVEHFPRLKKFAVRKEKNYDQGPLDRLYHDIIANQPDTCEPEWMDAEDPLFILYTSGSTGKPKGVVHTTGGYMIYAALTFKLIFDYQPGDVFWCTADIGWLTGHTMMVYGPLITGATCVLFEGMPLYPCYTRVWEIIEKYKVSQLFLAPTIIRSLMKFKANTTLPYDISSLKVLGTAGEPINREAWLWYLEVMGNNQCAVVDTYWQTETGGPCITPLPGATPTRPGSATFPFFGVVPVLLDETGRVIEGEGEGYLVYKQPWPGLMRTIYGDHERFEETYFHKFPGYYYTGDGATRDRDGYIWITGRVDDTLNVSGHLLSTVQVESAILEHKSVSEAAVVPVDHVIKGQALYCFVVVNDGVESNRSLMAEISDKVRNKIGPIASPEKIHFAQALPKTRSGKVMRRLLRKIAIGETDFGDISTLADESVIGLLLERPRA
ncbi:unnamed protein product, partial [Allacma fusca]